jgi:hypothetical protein
MSTKTDRRNNKIKNWHLINLKIDKDFVKPIDQTLRTPIVAKWAIQTSVYTFMITLVAQKLFIPVIAKP